MPDTIKLKFSDHVAWSPTTDITAHELALAIPVLFAMAHGATTSAEQARWLPPNVARHFKVTPNPLNK